MSYTDVFRDHIHAEILVKVFFSIISSFIKSFSFCENKSVLNELREVSITLITTKSSYIVYSCMKRVVCFTNRKDMLTLRFYEEILRDMFY